MAKKKIKIEDASIVLKNAVIRGIQEKKGQNIMVLNLKNVENSICDFFIICNADSGTQVEAIADSVHIEVKKATGENPSHAEGFTNLEWILLDYFNVVVHIFKTETREFYNLEKLWADAELEELKEIN
jgi:ribosome-associated protein